jgi:hypothetical protein
MELQYNLHGCIIVEADDKLFWCRYLTPYNDECLSMYWGKACVEKDVLILSTWKGNFPNEDTITDAKVKLANLPVWDKTKYYIDYDDFGEATLAYCQDDKLVTDKDLLHEYEMKYKGLMIPKETEDK